MGPDCSGFSGQEERFRIRRRHFTHGIVGADIPDPFRGGLVHPELVFSEDVQSDRNGVCPGLGVRHGSRALEANPRCLSYCLQMRGQFLRAPLDPGVLSARVNRGLQCQPRGAPVYAWTDFGHKTRSTQKLQERRLEGPSVATAKAFLKARCAYEALLIRWFMQPKREKLADHCLGKKISSTM